METTTHLPPATKRALIALNGVENKRMTISEFRKAASVKSRAFHLFFARLERETLVARGGYIGAESYVEITFKGMQTLKNLDAKA